MKQNQNTIDNLIADFKTSEEADRKGKFTEEYEQLNVWVPKEVKQDFRELQKNSKKKFGKTLQKIVIVSIQKAKA